MMDAEPKIKRAKREDGSYGLRIHGSFRSPKFDAWSGTGKASAAGADGGAAEGSKKKPAKSSPGADSAFKRRTKDRTAPKVQAGTNKGQASPPPAEDRSPPVPVVRSRPEKSLEAPSEAPELLEPFQLPPAEEVVEAPVDEGPPGGEQLAPDEHPPELAE